MALFRWLPAQDNNLILNFFWFILEEEIPTKTGWSSEPIHSKNPEMNKMNVCCLLILILYNFCGFSQGQTYDLVIENARIVDGTGEEFFWGQVALEQGEIALVERDTSVVLPARKRIDARGKVLSPGFIDTHAHGSPLATPEFRNFLAMGVTSISLGQDGSSPREKDLRTWMKKVNSVDPGVNVAMFAGHNTLRELSGTNYDTIPSEEHMARMEELLTQALKAGCFGMTTGLEYNPGYYAGKDELHRLARVVGEHDGIIMSHMRNEDDSQVEASIRELLAQEAHCPVHISHIKVVYGKGEDRADEILGLLDSARAGGARITADLYPYNASYTGIGILFPSWAKKPNDYQEVLRTRRNELAEYLREIVKIRNGPEATLIGSGPYSGKTLEEISRELDKPFEEILLDDIGPYGAGAAYFVMDKSLQERLMVHPAVNICTDGSPTMRHPRGYGSFSKIIETYVLDQELLSLEAAVHKMSGLPAATIGLEDRGLIKPGFKADLLVFDPSEVRENATFENPHQLASGMDYVIINGRIAKEGGAYGSGRGVILKKK